MTAPSFIKVALVTLVTVSVAILGFASPVHAFEDYADEIKLILELPDKPSCTFCHTRNDQGFAGDTLFSDSLKDRGLSRRGGLPSVRRAISVVDEMNIDSDGDGVGDIDELRAGANPNDARDKGLPPPDDCSVATGSTGRTRHISLLSWLLLGFGWLHMRKHQARDR
jgi:hypothetical protein